MWGRPADSRRGELLRDKTALIQSSAADAQRVVSSLCPSCPLDMLAVDANSAPVLDSRACAAFIQFTDMLRHDRDQGAGHPRIDISMPTASTTSKAPILKTQCPSMLPSKVTMLCTDV